METVRRLHIYLQNGIKLTADRVTNWEADYTGDKLTRLSISYDFQGGHRGCKVFPQSLGLSQICATVEEFV